jgi:hypothetical protein
LHWRERRCSVSLVMAEQFNAALKGDKPVGEALEELQRELQT